MRSSIAALVAALLVASPAAAQDRRIVTEAEFLAAVGEGHPALSALRRGIGLAEADEVLARTLQAPELELQREAPGAARQLDATLRWKPPRPDRRLLAIAAAEAGTTSARAAYEVARRRVLEQAREDFARWAAGSAAVEILERQAAEHDALAQRELERARAGEVSGLEANRVALAAARVQSDLGRAEAERVAALAAARAWIPELASGAAPELPPLPPPSSVASEVHPRIAALQSELEGARLSEQIARKATELPAVVAGWQRQEVAGSSADGPVVGLAWMLPLFDRGRAQRLAARARIEGLEAELELAELELAAAREGALAAYDELRSAALAAAGAAAGIAPIVSAASASFAAGETDLTDLLDALRSSAEFQLDALELHAEALEAHRLLERALATRTESDPSTSAHAASRSTATPPRASASATAREGAPR